MTDIHAEILARTHPVQWAMPEGALDHRDVAGRDEILNHRLNQAARSVWLAVRAWSDKADHLRLEPTAEWLTREVQTLRVVLDGADPNDDGLRAYVLRYLGISQSWKQGSASHERTWGETD